MTILTPRRSSLARRSLGLSTTLLVAVVGAVASAGAEPDRSPPAPFPQIVDAAQRPCARNVEPAAAPPTDRPCDDEPADASVVERPEADERASLVRTLTLVAASSRRYTEERDCFSCHHQTLPVWALSAAQRSGIDPAPDEPVRQSRFTRRDFTRRLTDLTAGEREAAPGGPFTAGYALLLLDELNEPRDAATDALAIYLASQQAEDGSFWIRPLRPPLEQSPFTATALALRGLQRYGSSDGRAAGRIDRARRWLARTPPATTEDRVFQIWGLHWAGAAPTAIAGPLETLAAEQRDDGGWGEKQGEPSQAYSTGQVVFTLKRLGAEADRRRSERIAAGAAWLRKHRLPDGSWKTVSRARPVQEYFESGFPHDESQFLSIAATCWSVLALLDRPPHVFDRPTAARDREGK